MRLHGWSVWRMVSADHFSASLCAPYNRAMSIEEGRCQLITLALASATRKAGGGGMTGLECQLITLALASATANFISLRSLSARVS